MYRMYCLQIGAAGIQVNQQLRKRIYSTAEREARKKNRNDMKE